jgi:DNA modification methylase
MLVWEKDGPGQGDLNTWGMGMEFCLYYKKGNRVCTDKRRNAVLHTPQLRPSQLIHPHEKPVQLLEGLIKHSTSPGDFVIDPFGGSASLARAARNTDRSCLCIEYDEYNYEQAKKKFEQEGEGLGF